MKFTLIETFESKKRRWAIWHRYFAWYPVSIGTKTLPNGKVKNVYVLFSFVERMGTYFHGEVWFNKPVKTHWKWIYREIEKDDMPGFVA